MTTRDATFFMRYGASMRVIGRMLHATDKLFKGLEIDVFVIDEVSTDLPTEHAVANPPKKQKKNLYQSGKGRKAHKAFNRKLGGGW